MGVLQNEHPARTSPHVCPDRHGLVQKSDQAWTEASLWMLVKSINQVVDRMERMFECRRQWCCELQMLQNCLKMSSGHVSMQTKWGTTICVIRPKHSSWHSLCCPRKEKKNRHDPQKLTPCKQIRKGFVCGLENGCFELLQRKNWRKKPNTVVCIDGSALTNKEGWTSLIPATLLASKASLLRVGKCHQRHCHSKLEYFREQAHYHCQLQILVLENSRCLHSRLTWFYALRSHHPPTATFLSLSTSFVCIISNKDSTGPSSVTLQNQATAWRIWPSSKSSCCIDKQTCQRLETMFSSCPMTRRLPSTSFLVAFGYLFV